MHSSQMKILHFSPYFLPHIGGVENYIYNLSRYLVKRGHEVAVISSNLPESQTFEVLDGITVKRYPCTCEMLRNPIVPSFFSRDKEIQEYDVINVHNIYGLAALAGCYYKRKYQFPLVITHHGRLIYGERLKDLCISAYSTAVMKRILSCYDAIIANSEEDEEYIASFGHDLSEKIAVAHNAVDQYILEKTEPADLDHLLEGEIKILYVGGLIRRKGIEWLLRAMQILKAEEKIHDIRCFLVGSGAEERLFREMARRFDLKGNVRFLGRVSDTELAALYRGSDIFTLPSLSEVCPTVMLEAMYFGLPVIASDIPGIRDHFRNYAILTPSKDEKALSSAILELARDSGLRSRLSRNGAALIRRKYTWSAVATMYEDIYRGVRGYA